MSIKKALLGVTSTGILAGTIYLYTGHNKYVHEPIKVIVSNTSNRVEQSLVQLGEQSVYRPSPPSKTIKTHNDIEGILDFLDKNLQLKIRVQGMSWYRDFFTGKISKEIFEQHLFHAQNIEQIFIQHSGMLQKIQHEKWWEKYLRGEISPLDIFMGNISSLIRLVDLEKKDPEFYKNIQKNPNWNQGVQHGDNYIVVGQVDFAISANLRLEQIKNELGLREELARFGFSEKDIFTADWSTGQGFYGAIDVIRQIQAMDSERLKWFYSTQAGHQYREGRIIDWIQLEQLLER